MRRSPPLPRKAKGKRGPFLFQVRFIQDANAAGAKVDKALTAAVSAEAAEIRRRMLARPSSARRKPWREPTHYVLLTNAPLSPRLRAASAEILRPVLPTSRIHTLGGADICDMLDQQPSVRRSFPQLLGVRDLEEVLQAVVNKENVQRSAKAIELAREVSSLFVPTGAYRRAWEVLRKHHFVVLEGPPEMGKTAIAWMIALVQVTDGWEAVVCDEPEHFSQRYGRENSQIFVADDAFGRTEYDPSRGRKWERRLDEVLRATDRKHWLVWTSRRHILERAVRTMDLTGAAERFPKPAAVLVDAGKLDTREKALILYRHARAAQLPPALKEIVRFCARQVVSDIHFTPERIRRFVREELPGLDGLSLQRGEAQQALTKIEELTTDLNLRNGFLGTMRLQGIKLAISDAGGATGSRRLPLMTGSESWTALRRRCEALVREGAAAELTELLTVLTSAVEGETDGGVGQNLRSILAEVCECTRVRWNQSAEVLGSAAIASYCEASVLLDPLPPMPNLRPSWEARERSVMALVQAGEPLLLNLAVLEEWAATASAIAETEPRMLRQIGFPEESQEVVEAVMSGLLEESEDAGQWDDYDGVMSDVENLHKGSQILQSLCGAVPSGPWLTRCQEAAQQLEARAERLESDAHEMRPPEEQYDSEYQTKPAVDFNVEALFADL